MATSRRHDLEGEEARSPSDPHVVEDQTEALAFLEGPGAHPGANSAPVRIDTHGAVVFLADADAFKVKRAVRYPFMDLSTLEKRRRACEAEVAINTAMAPSIYLGTVPITRAEDGGLRLGGRGEVIEWAVHMRRFDETQTLDRVADRGELTPDLCAAVARAVLASHDRAPRRDGGPATAALASYIEQNELAFGEMSEIYDQARAARLSATSRSAFADTRRCLLERGWEGFVRRCHGDLHLRNLVILNGKVTLFDAIEFDEAIATGDVLYDLAFLLMDLWERELRTEANLVLNRYLWESADDRQLRGLAALPLFLSLRAAIRSKVTAASLPHLSGGPRASTLRDTQRYFACSEAFLAPGSPRLIAIGGLSGTGKSTLAAMLAGHVGRPPGAVHFRSDIERKRLLGIGELEPLPASGYEPAVTARVYARLREMAAIALKAGQSVIIDAVHRWPRERDAVVALAIEARVPFTGLWLEAPTDLLQRRVAQRRGDASDATPEIVARQAADDLGEITWDRLDASAPIERTLAAALSVSSSLTASKEKTIVRRTEE